MHKITYNVRVNLARMPRNYPRFGGVVDSDLLQYMLDSETSVGVLLMGYGLKLPKDADQMQLEDIEVNTRILDVFEHNSTTFRCTPHDEEAQRLWFQNWTTSQSTGRTEWWHLFDIHDGGLVLVQHRKDDEDFCNVDNLLIRLGECDLSAAEMARQLS